MAKFIFKMQNILNLREKLEEQQKTAFRNANAALSEEQQKLYALIDRRKHYEEELKKCQEDSIDLRQVIFNKNAIDTMKSKIRDQMFAVKKAEDTLEIERAKLDEAIKDRKIQEKLKEKAFEDFKKEIAASESKEIDELVSFTYGKR